MFNKCLGVKKIILISANRFCEPYPVYPLGVSYLKTFLDSHLSEEFQVSILDCNMYSNEELSAKLKEENPFFVGVSFRNVDGANSLEKGNFLSGYKEIVGVVQSATSAHLCIGGSGFSIFPKYFMEETGADFGIVGEGELSLKELIEKLDRGEDFTSIEGLILPGEEKPKLPHIKHVSSLDVHFEDDLVDYYWKYSGMINIQTKRGCPYNCVYCSYPVIDGRKLRTLDPDKIVSDIKYLRETKNINYFFFTDSVFNIGNEFNLELAEKLVKENLKIRWGAYFSPKNLPEEHLKLFKASGLTHIEFGTESLSDETLNAYGKLFTFSDVKQASDLCVKHGVYYAHFLILGGYGETEKTIQETINNSKLLESTVYFPYIGMRIYPYTKLHQIAINEGVITSEDDLVDPRYYIVKDFDLGKVRKMALETGKAWVFPDDPANEMMDVFRLKKNKKGPIWEYLRKY